MSMRYQDTIVWILIFAGIALLTISIIDFSHSKDADPEHLGLEKEFIDVHEQIATIDQVPRFLAAMDRAGIDRIILLGSPEATFTYQPGFKNHYQNNEELFRIHDEFPDRFIIFPTIDPREPGDFEIFKSYLERGASGLRLFSGQYAWFYEHIGPVNRSELFPILKFCEENEIPVMYNMNPGITELKLEFEDVLRRYPNLKIVCPHFCLSTINSDRFEYLMDTYPNLYTDISFGHFFEDGFKRISRNTTKFRKLFYKYQDRILFGVDLVITNKTMPPSGDPSEWMYNLTKCYRDMLEKDEYYCGVKIKRVFNASISLSGLHLNQKILEKIYYENPKKYLGLD